MTKTKVDAGSPTQFASPKDKRLRHRMESANGSAEGGPAEPLEPQQGDAKPAAQPPQVGAKKRVHRAPSPARPKDVPGWSLTKIRGGIGAPTLSVKPGAIHIGGRASRRSPLGGKEAKPEKGKPLPARSAAGLPKSAGRAAKVSRRKVSDASNASDDLSKDSGCAPGKMSPTDSSSELSDCASEENKVYADTLSSDTESSSRGAGGGRSAAEKPHAKSSAEKDRLSLSLETGEGSISPGEEKSATSFDSRMPASTSLAFSDLTEEFVDGMHEEFAREIEELRSENDYLKDEMEELRSEMLEMRDTYLEEDVYQLQDLRQQLDQANKTCRILQYRLRKAERRSLRVAQTGQVDGELIRTLEQDVKVAKDVSIRLHNELDGVEDKRTKLEQENEDLRVRLQDLEVAKQVLEVELDKNRENPLKKRGARPSNKPDKKPSLQQEDSSDLKCQLHFAKEESALMCKKLTKLVKDSEGMKEELAKYRSLYGEVDASLTVEEVADSPHTREAEVRVHLKLVEEEANLLSRRIVELEVENRGLRAEMDDMKCQDLPGGPAAGHLVLPGSAENVMELQRHLQFVEEEAELLRRSLLEMEEQNKLLLNELNRYKSELPIDAEIESSALSSLMLSTAVPTIDPAAFSEEGGPSLHESSHEELLAARLQIGELSGKVKKLQYENRVLLSNLQRCDLASSHCSAWPSMETDAEAGDSAECVPSQTHREGPIGGERIDTLEGKEEWENLSIAGSRSSSILTKDHETLLAIRDQARLVTTAIQLLTSSDSKTSNCLIPRSSSSENIYRKISTGEAAESPLEMSPAQPEVTEALGSRLRSLQTQLQDFVDRVEVLGDSPGRDHVLPVSESGGSSTDLPSAPQPRHTDRPVVEMTAGQKSNFRDQSEREVKGQEAYLCKAEEEGVTDSNKNRDPDHQDADAKEAVPATLSDEVQELQGLLAEAQQRALTAEQELRLQRQEHRDHTHNSSQTISQLQEEHQKALVRRDFQMQSLSLQTRLQQKFWSQERNLLVQETQQLKQSLLLLGLKLRWFLKQWRLGKKLEGEGKDILEVNNMKDLYLLLEEEGLATHQVDNKMSAAEEQPLSPTAKELCMLEKSYKQQSSGLSGTLADLKGALQDLSAELREERQGSQELTQQFARAKASWEVERTELKSLITQLEGKAGKTSLSGVEKDPPDLKGALKREREEHQHLLADSYAAVMDLTKQLQIGERNWNHEKLELLEHFNQERSQWEQRLREIPSKGTQSQSDKASERETSDTETNGTGIQRTKSIPSEVVSEVKSILDSYSFLMDQEVNGTEPTLQTQTGVGEFNRKNWKYLSSDCAQLEKGDPFKTWDCPSTSSFPGLELNLAGTQQSYTAPDKTGIRIYYSPPMVRRMERSPALDKAQPQPAQNGNLSQEGTTLEGVEPQTSLLLSAQSGSSLPYEQWLKSLSQQHRGLLEGRTSSSASFHGLEMSGNLSDDMKEMTNCVRQAIRSSSLERKCSKDVGSQTMGLTSTGTQTGRLVSVGLQTDNHAPVSSRGVGLHGKSWSPRPSSASSSLASVRSRQISSSLEKVQSRIDRPCCSPKYGSPKLQRRVSSSSSKIDGSSGSSSSRDRSLWNLHQRAAHGGSAWARSTTTRDSPVLSGLNDGLSSLFSVVEHSGSVESLWRSDAGSSPARQPPAGKPSCPSVGIGVGCGETGAHRYGIVQEFIRNVCGSRMQTSPGGHRDTGSTDEPKPECLSATIVGNDSVTKIVNKRFMKATPRDDVGTLGKDPITRDTPTPSTLEDGPCDCTSQSLTSCFSRPSHAAVRHSHGQCKHRLQDSTIATEEKLDTSNE
ncbi:protein SOGA1 isoform X2 [Denticeps clupeoides]|uniref:DUF4482 domain-containing protein n=1 Tax=Denticeps clupeoides TaxID=299321 RepID=A0AAY4DUR5_9TELE|nr:protein SOGA1 isoform X2 [Denticeps clupeoides]